MWSSPPIYLATGVGDRVLAAWERVDVAIGTAGPAHARHGGTAVQSQHRRVNANPAPSTLPSGRGQTAGLCVGNERAGFVFGPSPETMGFPVHVRHPRNGPG